jgi:hypothetical protein
LKIRQHWQSEVEKISTNGYFRILGCTHSHTNKILILYSMYDNWGENLSHKKMQNKYGSVSPMGQPDPGNQRPDKWSSIVPAIYFNAEQCQVKAKVR